jgi:hypothetical protein
MRLLGAVHEWASLTAASITRAAWPIQVDVPLARRGFRCALSLSQAKFAGTLGQNRINIEWWETGGSRPFLGRSLSLLAPAANSRLPN